MKQVTIKAKATIVVVDLPENFTEVHLSDKTRYADGKGNRLTLHVQHRKRLEGEDLHTWLSEQHSRHIFDGDGEYKLLGHPSQLTEEDWKGIVDSDYFDRCRERLELFVNYSIQLTKTFSDTMSATESGLSLLKANGVVMENPRGDQPHNTGLVHLYPTGHPIDDIALKEAIDWLESQEQVWLNPQIFVKV